MFRKRWFFLFLLAFAVTEVCVAVVGFKSYSQWRRLSSAAAPPTLPPSVPSSEKVEALRREVESLKVSVPAVLKTSDVFRAVLSAASSSGVQVQTLTFSQEKDKSCAVAVVAVFPGTAAHLKFAEELSRGSPRGHLSVDSLVFFSEPRTMTVKVFFPSLEGVVKP